MPDIKLAGTNYHFYLIGDFMEFFQLK